MRLRQRKETLEILYTLWIEKRKGMNLSSRTIQRNRNPWEKYYENTKIIRKSIDRISVEDIEDYFHGCISEYDLTKKELDNMKLICKDLLKYAKKGMPIEDIRCYLGHNDIATTRSYILNNQGKQKTSNQIVNALSEMNGSDVLMGKIKCTLCQGQLGFLILQADFINNIYQC